MSDDPNYINDSKEKEQIKERDKRIKYFDPDAQSNWLFKDDPEYTKKRKSKKKLKNK